MAEILPSFVQRTIPGSSYVTIVCSSENSNEANFCRSNEEVDDEMFKYTSISVSKKVPTENEDTGVAIGKKDENELTADEGEVTRIADISQGIASLALGELSDEEENLSGNDGPITVFSHPVEKPSIQLESSEESVDLVEKKLQGLIVGDQQTEIADNKKPLPRGPQHGIRTHGALETGEYFVGKFRKPCLPDVSVYDQQYQYVDPTPIWNFGVPPSQLYTGHHSLPSLNVLQRPFPTPQVTYPFHPGLNRPHHPNAHVAPVVNGPVVVAQSNAGLPGPGLLPVFSQINGSPESGYSASDELDLVSEYVKDQMRLEEQAKRMNQVSPRNIPTQPVPFPYIGDAAPTITTTTTTAVSNDPSVVGYASDTARRTGSSPCSDLWTPQNSGLIHIPSTVDLVDVRGTSPARGVSPASCLNAGPASRSSGSPGSVLLSPHQTVTQFLVDTSPGNDEVNRSQVWIDGLRCGSLSPVGSQISEHSGGQIARYEHGPNSVASLDSIHSSPMSAVEPESSGDESFEERQSKMAEAERKAEAYEKETLISPDAHGDMALHLAMIDDDWYLAEAIINRLVRLNLVKQVINVPNKLQQTPLCLAVICNKSGIVEKLVENGADVNVHMKTCHDKLGPKFCQPLHLAASRGQGWKKTLRQLMKAENIDLDAFNSDGKSALHCAIESHGKKQNDQPLDCKEILRLLAEGGANLNQPDCGHEKTPLHYAIERRDVGLVSRLLCLATSFQSRSEQSGVSQMLEAKTGNGNTALHLAASVEMNTPEHKKMIQQLMCKGADPSVKNSDGFLPRELTKNREIVELLKGRMVTGRSPYSDRKRTA